MNNKEQCVLQVRGLYSSPAASHTLGMACGLTPSEPTCVSHTSNPACCRLASTEPRTASSTPVTHRRERESTLALHRAHCNLMLGVHVRVVMMWRMSLFHTRIEYGVYTIVCESSRFKSQPRGFIGQTWM